MKGLNGLFILVLLSIFLFGISIGGQYQKSIYQDKIKILSDIIDVQNTIYRNGIEVKRKPVVQYPKGGKY